MPQSRGVAACKPAIEDNLSQDEDVLVSVNKFYIFKEQAVLEKQNSVRIPAEYVREVIDETGKSIKGVILPNPDKPWRELVVSRTSSLSRSKMIGSGELRPNQNRELAQLLHKDQQPKISMTEGELQQLLQKLQGQSTEEPKKEAVAVAPLQAAVAAAEPSKDEEVLVSEVPSNYLSLVSSNPSKGAGKGKPGANRGRSSGAGGKRKADNAALAGNMPKRLTCAASVETSSQKRPLPPDGASVGSSSSRLRLTCKRGSEMEKFLSQSIKYTTDLDPVLALKGQSLKVPQYQGARIVKCIEEFDQKHHTDFVSSTEFIELKAKMALIDDCEELYRLGSLSNSRKETLLQAVAAEVPAFPPEFQTMLVAHKFQRFQWVQESDVEAWLELIRPLLLPGAPGARGKSMGAEVSLSTVFPIRYEGCAFTEE